MLARPYVYKIVFEDDTFYIGMRTRNIKLGLHWSEDILKHYFTSSDTVKEKIKNGCQCKVEWAVEFDDIEGAAIFESNTINSSWNLHLPLCLNKHNGANLKFFGPISQKKAAAIRKSKGYKWWNKDESECKSIESPGEGWNRGRAKSIFADRRGAVPYHDGKRYIFIKPEDPVPSGFTRGVTDEHKIRNSQGNIGKVWFTNGTSERKLHAGNEPSGWYIGRSLRHNDNTKKRISQSVIGSTKHKAAMMKKKAKT